jgi:hypothetical protein
MLPYRFFLCSFLLFSTVTPVDGVGKTRRSLALDSCVEGAGLAAHGEASVEPAGTASVASEDVVGVSDSAADTSDGLGGVEESSVTGEESTSPDEDDSRDEDYVASGPVGHKRSRGVKGVRRSVRPRVGPPSVDAPSVESGEDGPAVVDADSAALPVVVDDPDWPVRGVGGFPPRFNAKAVTRPRMALMSLPELLLPKRVHSVPLEYARVCKMMDGAHRTGDGRMSGAWARGVEAMTGPGSPWMREVHRESRDLEVRYRTQVAKDKAANVRERSKKTFEGRTGRQLGLGREVLGRMWDLAEEELVEIHDRWIAEDIAEVVDLMQQAEEWRVGALQETCNGGVGPCGPGADDDDGSGGGWGGGGFDRGLGLAAVGLALASVTRDRPKCG